MEKIVGLESAYKDALEKKYHCMKIGNSYKSAAIFCKMVEHLSYLETAVIDLKASLRTCRNASSGMLEKYKDL